MNVIAIACYRRPEFLKVLLDRYLENEGIENYWVHFFLDVGYHPDQLKVINWFKEKHKLCKLTTRDKRYSACPAAYNIMKSYSDAADYASEYVLPGEEDQYPTKDFLKFHDNIYRNFMKKYNRIFCVAHKRRQELNLIGDNNVLIGDTQCTSPTIVSVEHIKNYMEPCYEEAYFVNPILYNFIYYGNSRIPWGQHYDHDGQIERIIEANELFALKPDTSRTSHIGFYGGANVIDNGDTLENKVIKIQEKIKDHYKLQEACKQEYNAQLKTEVALAPYDNVVWDKLELDLDRNKAKASSWWYDPDNKFKEYIISCTQ